MKVGFVNFVKMNYTVETPYKSPLGGSESAMCYLSTELANLGHEVKLFYWGKEEKMIRKVLHVPPDLNSLQKHLQGLDVLIVQHPPWFGGKIKKLLESQTKLILWAHLATDQPQTSSLRDINIRSVFDAFAFVSEWQMESYITNFQVEPYKSIVMRNALSPAFTDNFKIDRILKKTNPPIIAYTSTPFRGLNLLLDVFPKIRKEVPGTILRVYSSMKVYQTQDTAENLKLYRKAKKMAGVEYLGSVSQTRLAKELPEASVLAYPNTFPETSSIAVMEAMASGLQIVTSNFAALPETTAGFAHLIDIDEDDDNWEKYKQEFTDTVISCLKRRKSFDIIQKLIQQTSFANSCYNWKLRAKEWEMFLKML